jgi:PleD family two-component response regulator
VSASIGVVAWDGGEGLAGFIHQADEALYLAKQKGKNWVESSAGETAGSGFASGSMDDA